MYHTTFTFSLIVAGNFLDLDLLPYLNKSEMLAFDFKFCCHGYQFCLSKSRYEYVHCAALIPKIRKRRKTKQNNNFRAVVGIRACN